jgi:hypothetical protein
VKLKHGVRPKPFNHGISMLDATPARLEFLDSELPRSEACGAWERSDNPRYVSRMSLVPKPGCNSWRLIIDLRELNRYCFTFNMTCETLKHLRHLSRPGDYFFSLDLADGYYTFGIWEQDLDYFTVNYRGTLWRIACLPMGWSGSAFYFCKLTQVFTNHLRRPPTPTSASTPDCARQPSKRFLRNARWSCTRLLPYMDDFLFLTDSYHDALLLRQRVQALLDSLGLQRNHNKMRIDVDASRRPFRLNGGLTARHVSRPTRKTTAARTTRVSPTLPSGFERAMAAHASARGLRRESSVPLPRHRASTVLFTRARQRVSNTYRLGGTRAPKSPATTRPRVVAHGTHPTQRSVHLQAHPDRLPPRRLQRLRMGGRSERKVQLPSTWVWNATNRLHHITWKELRAVRHAVESFLPHFKGRQVLLHEDNTAVVAALTKLTSRSPVMMTELRRLWFLLDTNDIHIRPRYIRSAANVWADTLSRELDTEDMQLEHLQHRWGPHTIDRFASMLNAQLPRFNARWRDPLCEDIDRLHLSDVAWRREFNSCNPPWSALPTLAANWPKHKPRLLSPPLTGRTKRGTTLSPDLRAQPCTSGRPATCSFPAGSTCARGSDLPRGASWPFDSHPLLALHPTRSDWPSVTPGPINFYGTARSPSSYMTTSLRPANRISTGAPVRRSR